MRLTKNELKIITNYLEFDNHIPNLDSEDRIKLLNRFRTELPVNELNIHLVVGQSEQLKCSSCEKPLHDGLCGACCSDLASGNY